MLWQSFKRTVWYTSLLNEICLVFNSWILLPTADDTPTSSSDDLLPRPIVCAAIYAICEPTCTLLLVRVPIVPFVSVLVSSMLHLQLSGLVNETSRLIATQKWSREHSLDTRPTRTIPESKSEPHPHDGHDTDDPPTAIRRALRALAAAHNFSAAASNASLAHFSQSLEISGLYTSDTATVRWLSGFAFAFYLFTRYADYLLSERTRRSMSLLYLHHKGNFIKTAGKQMLTLLWLHAIRILARKVFSMPALALMQSFQLAGPGRMYEPDRYAYLHELIKQFPDWLSSPLALLTFTLMGLSGWFWGRAGRVS